MSFMHRPFGGSDAPPPAAPGASPSAAPAPSTPQGDTATVRRIVGQLEAHPPDRARLLAGAA